MRSKKYVWFWLALVAVNAACVMRSDNAPGAADPAVASPVSCQDEIKNGAETDIDCGGDGVCAACADLKACRQGSDCSSQSCVNQVCQSASCSDGVKNGAESDIDCGGSCRPCNNNQRCALAADCGSGICANGAKICLAAGCQDGVKNNTETDIDCGGGGCQPCGVQKGCQTLTDCNTGHCINNICDALPTCNQLHQLHPTVPSGVWVIDPGQHRVDEDPLPAYCDMTTDGGGWTLAFKISSAVNISAPGVWNANAVRNENNPGYLNLVRQGDHYANRLATRYWNGNGFTLNEARVGVYSFGVEQAFVQFALAGQDRLSWYSQAQITSSSWTDITTQPKNVFSINGDGPRKWFINRSYGGCFGDAGWLILEDPGSGLCSPYEFGPFVRIRYSNLTTYQTWATGSVGDAEIMAIFVR